MSGGGAAKLDNDMRNSADAIPVMPRASIRQSLTATTTLPNLRLEIKALAPGPADPSSCGQRPFPTRRSHQSALRASAGLAAGVRTGLSRPGAGALPWLDRRPADAPPTGLPAGLTMALPFGFPGLCLGLILVRTGSSMHHPRVSLLITSAYGKAPRGHRSNDIFASDLEKSNASGLGRSPVSHSCMAAADAMTCILDDARAATGDQDVAVPTLRLPEFAAIRGRSPTFVLRMR
jgi:hypothetical protein